jgi:FixJ family two-component response regulator
MGLDTQAFPSAEDFLHQYRPHRAGCLVADVRMCGMSGLELQEKLLELKIFIPVIILTAYARTPLTVRAMEHGAVTVLEKPYQDDDLWDAIRKALAKDAAGRERNNRRGILRNRILDLTPAQRQVMDGMLKGKANKTIAAELGVSVRTVEHRRSEVFSQLKAESIAELVRLVIEADVE